MLACWLMMWFDIFWCTQTHKPDWWTEHWVCSDWYVVFLLSYDVSCLYYVLFTAHRYTSYVDGYFFQVNLCLPVPDCQTMLYFDAVGDGASGRWKPEIYKNPLHRGYISCSLITTTSVQTQSFPAGCLSCHSTNWTNIVKAPNDGHYAHHCVQKLCWRKSSESVLMC